VVLRKLVAAKLMLALVAGTAFAGIRAPGHYAGIVVFDRWDTCYLYSGIYLMYISDRTKEAVRKYEGQSILIDAKEVYQPINPGDGRIGKFKVLKVLRRENKWTGITGLLLTVKPQFQNDSPKFLIEIENRSGVKVRVSTGSVALTLLGIKRQDMFSPSDGRSEAWLTRQPLKFPSFAKSLVPASERSTRSHHLMWKDNEEYYFDVEEELPDSIELGPYEKRGITLSFHLPKGQYDFLSGYAGGVHESRGLASNRVSFDVAEGGGAVEVSIPPHNQRAGNKLSQ
jgi:hypothetical protein